VKTKEPPCTEPYARWCERSGKLSNFPSYSILFSDIRKLIIPKEKYIGIHIIGDGE